MRFSPTCSTLSTPTTRMTWHWSRRRSISAFPNTILPASLSSTPTPRFTTICATRGSRRRSHCSPQTETVPLRISLFAAVSTIWRPSTAVSANIQTVLPRNTAINCATKKCKLSLDAAKRHTCYDILGQEQIYHDKR